MPKPGFESGQNPDLNNDTQSEYGWEKVLERDAANSRFLNTRLLVENILNIDEESAAKIRNLDTYLSQQLQQVLDEEYDTLAEAGKGKEEIEEALGQAEMRLTAELGEPEIKAAIEEIIYRAEHSKLSGSVHQEKPKLRAEYAALEEVILNKLKQRQAQGEAQPMPVVYDAEEVPPDAGKHKWKEEYVSYTDSDSGKVFMVSRGSYFALESGMAFINNPESSLAEHVYGHIGERNPKKRRGFALEDLESVSFRDKFPYFSRYLQTQFRNYKKQSNNSPRLPEEAQNEEDAIRLLSNEEIKGWFRARYSEYCEDHKVFEQGIPEDERTRREDAAAAKFERDGYTKLYFFYFPEDNPDKTATPGDISNLPAVVHNYPADQGVEVGEVEDLEMHQKRWDRQREAMKQKTYTAPESMHGMEVPPGVVAEFYRLSDGRESGLGVSAEVGDRVRNLQINWDNLNDGYIEITFTGKVEDNKRKMLKDRDQYKVINLPNEAVAAARAGDRQAIEDAIKDCLKINMGSTFVQANYDRSTGNVIFGLGKKDRPEIGIPLSPQDLRRTAAERAGEVAEYLDRRAKEFKQMDFEGEVEPMWAFEKYLLKQKVPDYDKELGQLAWDEAFAQVWKAKIGQEKLAELTVQYAEQPKIENGNGRRAERARRPGMRHPEKNKREISEEIGRKAAASPRGQKFLQIIEQRFNNEYGKFLTSGKFWEVAQEAGLNSESFAMNLMAEKLLLEKGRTKDYEAFQEFSRLPKKDQAAYLENKGLRDVHKLSTSGLMAKRLGLFFASAQEVDAAPARTKQQVRNERQQRLGQQIDRSEQIITPDRAPLPRDSVMDKIAARSSQRVAVYNPNYDPEVEAGII